MWGNDRQPGFICFFLEIDIQSSDDWANFNGLVFLEDLVNTIEKSKN